jgi:hypothetical protein
MKNEEETGSTIPTEVLDILKTSEIGYLSVTSEKGDLYSYPVAYYFTELQVYFMTPISAAKLRFVRSNPNVSFLVDNHLLTRGACGAMIQGRARVFSIAKTVLNIMAVGPKMVHFAKKYPGMFTFYASGKELPDERKLYKYRLIRIDPTKVLYWQGYKFGRLSPMSKEKKRDHVGKEMLNDPLATSSDEVKMDTLAKLMSTADEELSPAPTTENKEWFENLESAMSHGEILDEEKMMIDSYRNFLRRASALNVVGPDVTSEEKNLLKRWKHQQK